MALRAGFTDDLGINILTLQGQHILDWFPVIRGSQRAFRLTNGGVLKVRDYVRLHFWRDGASRSEEEEFYIPLNGNPNIQDIPNTHVILGLDCFLKLEDFTDSHSSLAPIQLGRQTKGTCTRALLAIVNNANPLPRAKGTSAKGPQRKEGTSSGKCE